MRQSDTGSIYGASQQALPWLRIGCSQRLRHPEPPTSDQEIRPEPHSSPHVSQAFSIGVDEAGTCLLTTFPLYSKSMVVRMRHTRSHTANRRSHHRVKAIRLSLDESGTAHVRHRMNPTTGKYRGRDVVDVIGRASKKAAKQKERAKATA